MDNVPCVSKDIAGHKKIGPCILLPMQGPIKRFIKSFERSDRPLKNDGLSYN